MLGFFIFVYFIFIKILTLIFNSGIMPLIKHTTKQKREAIMNYNSNDFSPNIDCWKEFLGNDLLPTDSEVSQIIQEADSDTLLDIDPTPENVFQEILLMRVGNKLVSESVKKVKEFLNNFNTDAKKKVSIPEDFEIDNQIENTLELVWDVNCRDTYFCVRVPYFNGAFNEFCKASGKFHGNYSESVEESPTTLKNFEDLIKIIAFHYCYDKLFHLYIEKEDRVGELTDLFNRLNK